jgi:hypothetical protein
MVSGLLAAAALLAGPASCAAQASPVVLARAYSHNDYKQPRPLFDALDRGFMGVEADCHLRGQELFVAHTGGGITPGRTLRTLYLDPLLARVRANGGRVYPGGPKGFLLMLDFKSDGEESYAVLQRMLEPYREMLTVYHADRVEEGAVTLVISGRRPDEVLRAQETRYAGIDGRLGDLGEDHPTLWPMISDSFASHFEWRGGRMDPLERERLARYVARAHARGRRLRFYAAPDREDAWELLLNAGVDLINTDHLEALRRFLTNRIAARPLPAGVSFDGAAR